MATPAEAVSDLQPYPAYKPSGVEWLGGVPPHWEVQRLKTLCNMRVSNVDKHVRKGETPVRLCNYVDVYKHDSISQRIDFMRATATPEEIEQFRLEEGDVLITKDSEAWDDIGVPAVVMEPAEDLISGYHLALLRPFTDVLIGGYLLRALQSKGLAHQFHVEAKGVTRYGLSHASVRSVWLAVPPLPEQAAIARYLDHADERIRRCIQAKEKLVELLEEQRQALFNEAVTGRVDVRTGQPYPEYKPSGVEWLGEVPAHWRIARNGQIFIQRNETGFPELPILEVSLNTGVSVRNLDNLDRKQMMTLRSGYKRAIAGDIAYNMMRMWQGAVGVTPVDGLVSPAYVVARPLDGTNPRYFSALFRTSAYKTAVDRSSRGIVKDRNRLYWSDFKQLASPYPPVEEQATIARYLDDSDRRIQRGIQAAQRQIDLLKEYRTRLIADVVTGKLDVREAPEALAGDLEEPESITGPGASAVMSGESARSPNVAPQGSDA